MSNPNYGIKNREWAKHLRRDGKREFWGRLRGIYAQKIQEEIKELRFMQAFQDEWDEEAQTAGVSTINRV